MAFPAKVEIRDSFVTETFRVTTEEELSTLIHSEADLFMNPGHRTEVRELIPRMTEFIRDQDEGNVDTNPDVKEWTVMPVAPTVFRITRH